MSLIEPVCPKAGNGRQPYLLKVMLKVHLVQNERRWSERPGSDGDACLRCGKCDDVRVKRRGPLSAGRSWDFVEEVCAGHCQRRVLRVG